MMMPMHRGSVDDSQGVGAMQRQHTLPNTSLSHSLCCVKPSLR